LGLQDVWDARYRRSAVGNSRATAFDLFAIRAICSGNSTGAVPMSLLILFIATSVIFLVADAIMLTNVIQPIFKRHLGDGLLGGFRILPAILFYFTFMFGVIWFAGWSALRDGVPHMALINGAILGFVAYATYELTSWTVMRDWHPQMVMADMAWGTVVTAGSAWGGVMVARAFQG
jgi:uncharacterized membrane protein